MKINYVCLLRSIIESKDYSAVPALSKFSKKQIKQLLRAASSNRVLFSLSKKIKEYEYLGMSEELCQLVDKIFSRGEKINKEYAIILKEVKKRFEENNIQFLIVKTDRKVGYILSDVDILVEDENFSRAKEILAKISIKSNIKEKEGRWHYELESQIKIDLHKIGTDWYSRSFFDVDSIWDDTEQRLFLDGIYRFPSKENDLILNAVNIIFERFTLTYLDLLYFRNSEEYRKTIGEISEKYGWGSGLRILRKYLDMADNAKCRLPLMFSFVDFLRIFISRLLTSSNRSHLTLYYFLYIIYCKLRFWLSGGYKISYAGQWFEFRGEDLERSTN